MKSLERISWIDTAKGFLILCVIAGHTLKFGSIPFKVIYSFHIPLFIILSGYTFSDVNSWKQFFYKIKKSFLQLIFPTLLVYLLEAIISFFKTGGLPLDILTEFFKKACKSGGIMWFLNALFWSRFLYSLILLFKLEKAWVISILFALNCLLLHYRGDLSATYQNLDIIFVFVFFIYVGRRLKSFDLSVFLEKKGSLILFFTLTILYSLLERTHFDLGLRLFRGKSLLPLLTFCGCFSALYFSFLLDSYSVIGKVLRVLGQNTIPLLIIHDLESQIIHWENICLDFNNYYLPCLMRLLLNLLIFFLYVRFFSLLFRQKQ